MGLYSRSHNTHGRAGRFLKTVSLFDCLDESELAEVAGRLTPRTYHSGITLFHQDMPGSMLYLIETGSVRVFSVGLSGQEHTFEIFGPGDFFGELSLLDEKYRSASAITLAETVIWLLPKKELQALLSRHPTLALRMIQALAGRVRKTANHLEAIIFQDVLGRLSFEILNLAKRYGHPAGTETVITVPLSQSDLGTIIGATRESVNKALAILKKRGLVDNDGSQLTVLDPQGLEDLVHLRGR